MRAFFSYALDKISQLLYNGVIIFKKSNIFKEKKNDKHSRNIRLHGI